MSVPGVRVDEIIVWSPAQEIGRRSKGTGGNGLLSRLPNTYPAYRPPVMSPILPFISPMAPRLHDPDILLEEQGGASVVFRVGGALGRRGDVDRHGGDGSGGHMWPSWWSRPRWALLFTARRDGTSREGPSSPWSPMPSSSCVRAVPFVGRRTCEAPGTTPYGHTTSSRCGGAPSPPLQNRDGEERRSIRL
jgi:hypothetical protein